jgi:hypothetical protein
MYPLYRPKKLARSPAPLVLAATMVATAPLPSGSFPPARPFVAG